MELVFKDKNIELIGKQNKLDIMSNAEFTPVQLVVSAVASCGMYVFRAILKNSGVAHEFVKTTVDFEVDRSTSVKPLKNIELVYYLKVDEDIKAKVERIKKLVAANCPVMQSLSEDVEVVEKIIYQ